MANIVTDIEEVSVEEDNRGRLPGLRLREVREQRGLSVADVAAALLLTEEQIRALEENDFKQFPAPLFIRAYLRKYAALLSIPEAPLIDAFENMGLEGPSLQAELTSSIPRPRRINLELSAGILVVVGVLILALVWLFAGDRDEEAVVQSASSTQIAGSDEESFLHEPPVSLQEAAAALDMEDSAPAEEAPQAVQSPPPQAASAPEPGLGTAPAPVLDRLLLQFNDDSWVEITDARGERLFFDLGRAGQSRLLEGEAPFDILLGNAPAVQIEYNGEPYNHKRFNRKNVARFKLGGEGG